MSTFLKTQYHLQSKPLKFLPLDKIVNLENLKVFGKCRKVSTRKVLNLTVPEVRMNVQFGYFQFFFILNFCILFVLSELGLICSTGSILEKTRYASVEVITKFNYFIIVILTRETVSGCEDPLIIDKRSSTLMSSIIALQG